MGLLQKVYRLASGLALTAAMGCEAPDPYVYGQYKIEKFPQDGIEEIKAIQEDLLTVHDRALSILEEDKEEIIKDYYKWNPEGKVATSSIWDPEPELSIEEALDRIHWHMGAYIEALKMEGEGFNVGTGGCSSSEWVACVPDTEPCLNPGALGMTENQCVNAEISWGNISHDEINQLRGLTAMTMTEDFYNGFMEGTISQEQIGEILIHESAHKMGLGHKELLEGMPKNELNKVDVIYGVAGVYRKTLEELYAQ